MSTATANETATQTGHLRTNGELQGLGFRWRMARLARSLGLGGWVHDAIFLAFGRLWAARNGLKSHHCSVKWLSFDLGPSQASH